jgi:Fungal specific transcription factor domain/Fungal Zn(2)-Cys(6) binuclear cluster domain
MMQTYSIATKPPQQGQKNYVFVDEHNRHKRLKVMRACEGCRRRKIRCDSATTNTWPCAACTRLKLHCVPPAGGVDGDFGTGASLEGEGALDLSHQTHIAQSGYSASFPSHPRHGFDSYNQYDPTFHKAAYFNSEDMYHGIYTGQQQYGSVDGYRTQRPGFPAPRSDSDTQQSFSSETPIEHANVDDLSQHLGDLKITETGVAPYVRQQKKDAVEPDGPVRDAQEMAEDQVDRAFKTDAGSHIRIPPALMPSNEDATALFEVFFKDVHPYAPVLNRRQFYQQWHTDKEAVSPLVLEAVFACAGRIADEPSEGAQWLALANKHEAYFLDTPRLSTVQALLLLLKAREGAPKRGYYYRSWMTCKTIVTMAKDLELHEHNETHESGGECGSDPVECLTKTRVWQTALICEMMVGAPQGLFERDRSLMTADRFCRSS